MELEFGNDDESEEICTEDEDYNVDSVSEEERCGICIDIVIDRGVLDCCDHWFCFACIDNWATITNFCPICKNEFQLITCLPVYDTIRSSTSEEHSPSRNGDWSIQGMNNALSFPSYYISEDAVKCLEHDGCKIRMLPGAEDLSFDTSIACDSCDIWYHAFCVGFNPQLTSENSWLCPRCINNETPQNSSAVPLQSPVKYCASQNAAIGWTIDPSLSGKVAVSVADTGETAVVVSMIAGQQKAVCERSLFDTPHSNMDSEIAESASSSDNETSETALLEKDGSCMQVSQNNLIFKDYKEHTTSLSDIDNRSEVFFDLLPEIIDFRPYGDLKDAIASSSFSDVATTIKPRNDITDLQSPPTLKDVPCYSEANDEGKNINSLETRFDSVYSEDYMDPSFPALCTSEANEELDDKSSDNIDTCLAATFTSSADNMVTSCNKDMLVDICQKSEEGCNSVAEPSMNKESAINIDETNYCIRKREQEDVYPTKKPKLDRKFKSLHAGDQPSFTSLDGSQVYSRKMRGASLGYAEQQEAEAPDIMSIIQESDSKSEMNAANDLTDKKDNSCGLRVKKIMRRVGEKRESSILAQELGKEIREAVQKKTLKDVGKNDFDEKLLEAFRAAMTRPQTELASSERVPVGSKKPLPVKGKKRENLTKKIYGTSSGRRRHAWARDLEIEFWKHRCRSAQYEKVETLQSVLELLKKATNPNWNSYMESDSQEESANSILSRVYVADASVFPRKDDIKPLSEVSGSSLLNNHNEVEEKRNAAKGVLNGFPEETSIRKVNSRKCTPDAIQRSGPDCSKENITISKEQSYPPDAKTDKRKWALEVLARKTASANVNGSKGQEYGDLFKRNYPLLAQLPQDMKPILASTGHNKVSTSIRQAQLYRITEHYLRRANLPVIRRTAETELAVADAVNVEKEILERSNSKLVYVNLCSQVLSQVANMQQSAEASISVSPVATNEVDANTKSDTEIDDMPELAETNFSNSALPTSEISNEVSGEVSSNSKACGWSNVEEALKLAGLFDCSPSSPCASKDSDEDQCTKENVNEILNFDNKPESAETNLSSSTLPTSEISNEVSGERNSDTKAHGWNNVEEALKLAGLFDDSPPSSPYCARKESNEDECLQENVHEILNCDAQGDIQHSMDTDGNASTTQNPGKAVHDCIDMEIELPFDFSNSLEQHKDCRPENSFSEVMMDACLPTKVPEMGTSNDLSLEECAGRNKVPIVSQISEKLLATGVEKNVISSCEKDRVSVIETDSCISDPDVGSALLDEISAGRENLGYQSTKNLQIIICDNTCNEDMTKSTNDKSDHTLSVSKKVEAYIKEHIRPLCKSGVITVGQYRWAVGKTLLKVMKYHQKAKNPNFLIREGENVKRLAEKYVEAAQKQRIEVDKMSR